MCFSFFGILFSFPLIDLLRYILCHQRKNRRFITMFPSIGTQVDLRTLRAIRVLRPLKLVSGIPSEQCCASHRLTMLSSSIKQILFSILSNFIPYFPLVGINSFLAFLVFLVQNIVEILVMIMFGSIQFINNFLSFFSF